MTKITLGFEGITAKGGKYKVVETSGDYAVLELIGELTQYHSRYIVCYALSTYDGKLCWCGGNYIDDYGYALELYNDKMGGVN